MKILPHQLVAFGAGAGTDVVVEAGAVIGLVDVFDEDSFFIFDSTSG